MEYTQEIADKICGLIAAGSNKKDAALLAGVTEPTLYRWVDEGIPDRYLDTLDFESPEERLEAKFKFREDVKRASASFKATNIAIIRKAAGSIKEPKSWQAAAWLLERKFQSEYAIRRLQIDSSHTEKRELNINLQVNDGRAAKVLQILAKAGALQPGPQEAIVAEDDEVHPDRPD